jgi:hypothetical protein
MWREVLKSEPLGVHDSLIELGCGSFLATYLLSKVCTTYRIDLPEETFFRAPTIAQLAKEVVKRL